MGGVRVEERGVVGGGRCAAYTDTDGALRANREWRRSCDPLYHFVALLVAERSSNTAAHEPCRCITLQEA
jgi:hypothetical protein